MTTGLRLLRFLTPFWRRVILATVLGAVVIASNMGLLGAAAYLIAAAARWHLLVLLLVPISLVRILSVTRGVARYAERLLSHNVTFKVLAGLRVWLYDHLIPGALVVTPARHSGDSLSRLTVDIDELQNAYLRFVSPFAVALVIATLLVALLHVFSDVLAGVIAIYLVAAGLALPLAAYALSRGFGGRHVAAKADLNAHLVDSIQGVQDVLMFGTAEARNQISVLDRVVGQVETRMAVLNAGREGASDLLAHLGVLTALAVSVSLVAARSASGLYLAVPALLVLAGFEAVRPLALAAQGFDRTRAAGERVLSVAGLPRAVTEHPAAISGPIAGAVGFHDVTFTYPDASVPAVRDVTFTVPAGARIALIGPSGAGKSTLAQLMLRAWDPAAGDISFGGRDIREYRLGDLRSTVALVAQDTFIFNDTLRNNLLLASPGASDQAIDEALEAAQLAKFITALPDGMDTVLGEHGMRLSGGERQRLAIARAVLKDAPLLVLDEATANLDPATEASVLDALDAVMLGRTAVMITHRLVLMERMDQILVLDRGRIVERGTHRELLAANGLYRRMVDVQDNVLPA